MRKIADEREAAVLMLYWSAGLRRGVGSELRIRDLKPLTVDVYNIFEITCYRESPEEYRTWCTPEARKDIEAYFKFRERYGEKIDANSPVFRDKFDTTDQLGARAYPQPLAEKTIYTILAQLTERSGLRKRVVLEDGQKAGKVRHDIKAVHGLRKGFDTICTNSGITPLWVEYFERRQLVGSKGRYYRPTDKQLLEGIHETKMRGYIYTINGLTIDEANRLQVKNKKLEAEYNRLQSETSEMLKWYAENVKGKQ